MKLVIGLTLFIQVLFSAGFTYPDFKQCYTKNKKAFVYFGDLRAVAVGKYSAIAYSKTEPTVPYVKHDPFLNLYLFKSKKPLNPVKLKSTYSLKVGEWIAGMDEQSLFAGNFAKSGDVLNTMYLQNASIGSNSIISCLCCEVYGLGIGKGQFIGSEYIRRFIDGKSIYYGDIGARFEQRADKFYVSDIDPFFANQKLKVGDEIVKIGNKKIYSLKDLNQRVLFSKPKSKLTLHVKRENKIHKISTIVAKRSGGGDLYDSFLEKKGLFFDKKLRIKRVAKDSFADIKGLKVGDKILQVNQTKVDSISQLRNLLSKSKGKQVSILFDRNDFQFFVNIVL